MKKSQILYYFRKLKLIIIKRNYLSIISINFRKVLYNSLEQLSCSSRAFFSSGMNLSKLREAPGKPFFQLLVTS